MNANFTSSQFGGANLAFSTINGSNIQGASFAAATLANLRVTSVTGSAASLPTGWNQLGSLLLGPGVRLYGASLANLNLGTQDLTGASLSGVDITNAVLASTTLTNIVGAGATGIPASLPANWIATGTNLVGPSANDSGANFSHADLSGLNLANANFSGATFYMANLSNDNLSGVNFSYVGMQSANLTNSTLTNANLSQAMMYGDTLTGVVSSGIVGQPASLPTGWSLVAGVLTGP